MRHASVQVRGKLTRDELQRYDSLFEVGKFLEASNRYDLAYILQKEIEYLIQPAIDRLKDGSKERDRINQEFIEKMNQTEAD